MEPSKGRIVNYHCIESERYLCTDSDMILPAIIIKVHHGSEMKAVDLIVLTHNPSAIMTMRTSVAMGLTNGGGWTWPTINKVNDGKVEAKNGPGGQVSAAPVEGR